MTYFIQVCGDPTVDWFRIHHEDVMVRGGVYYWQKQAREQRVHLSSKPGGSALVLQLAREMIPEHLARVEGAALDDDLLNRPKDGSITTSWTLWKEFPNPGLNTKAFRLWKWHEFETACWDYPAARLSGCPDLLVIQDSGLGFRTCPQGWPQALSLENDGQLPKHILYKLGQYSDGQENPLLSRITELGLAERTTMLSSLSDLRACAVKVGTSLSWERMLEEVAAAVLSPNCPFIEEATGGLKYYQIIVPIGMSGAVIVRNESSTLIFDRNGQEGDFSARFPGQVIGDNTCIMGILAASWAADPQGVDWTAATRTGIELARLLHIKGYEVVDRDAYRQLQFPFDSIAEAFQARNSDEHRSTIAAYRDVIGDLAVYIDYGHSSRKRTGKWTILEDTLLKTHGRQCYLQDPQSIRAVNECARNIVVQGPHTALPDVPLETIGAWCSADRQEIEGVRSVNNAMRDYLLLKNPETPLCVAVFGPPGAGKSFAIKEMARGLGLGETAQLTFNLSQFESPAELQNAFNQIRDLNLKGKTPLVFWDEFDTPCEGQPLGWLRYFLAPMQDGEFTHQGLTHPLGGGIYVFAGATRHSFEEFRSGNSSADRAAKKPDFISRLRAFINIRGINGNPNSVEDRLYMIRRAFILRQYLETNVPQIKLGLQFDIEPCVLDAFLLVNKYRHGARSLENLLKMSNLADKRKYELSSLPPDHILEMHVSQKEFNDLTCLGHREMLRLGISGHVHLNPGQIGEIKQAARKIRAFLEQQFPQHYLTVFSPLAAGADRLVARQLLKTEASRLIAVLPYAQEEYIHDFETGEDERSAHHDEDLRGELEYWLTNRAMEIIEMPPAPTRRAAYQKAGRFIVEHSDILIVVWDGNRDPGSSTTAWTVARAEALHIPICHIWAENHLAPEHAPEMTQAAGDIRYQNFPGQIPGLWENL